MGSPARLRSVRMLLPLVLAACLIPGVARAQYFGQNKVQYRDFDFRILQTEHFDIYYYPEEAEAVREAARLAERWYARLSKVLDHRFEDRQPLILYGSHPDFTQTNVIANFLGEEIGGVTESLKRRIVMPFAPGLSQTDHVLGHEIVHAFQFDIARRHRTGMRVPLWFAEGMAEYLSLGGVDAHTAMWIRDAAQRDELPAIQVLGRLRLSPYRYGHALWAYIGGRFGDEAIGRILKARPAGNVVARIERVTGMDIATLTADWHASIREVHGPALTSAERREPATAGARLVVSRRTGGGRLNLAPVLSPDGRRMVFLSEKDQFSIDVFLADARTGETKRTLLTTAADPHVESLQSLNSTGAWHPEGGRFLLATVQRGRPVLMLLDTETGRRLREIPLPGFGQVLNPAWSPDGRAVVFSGLKGGLTNLYIYELDTGEIRRLTGDRFADLQPAWSPDGRALVFVTDRFSTDLQTLAFGRYQLALIDAAGGEPRPLPLLPGARHLNPHWSADGRSLFFLADPGGITNVFRFDVEEGLVYQVTDVRTGVSGLTANSPALSVAPAAPAMAFSVYRAGAYELHVLDGPGALAGRRVDAPVAERGSAAASDADADGAAGRGDAPARLAAAAEREGVVAALLDDPAFGLPDAAAARSGAHRSKLTLDAFGAPYLTGGGGGGYGTVIRGGMSMYFGDMLGDRRMATAFQLSNDPRDIAAHVQYRDRSQRWVRGFIAEQMPYMRAFSRLRPAEVDGAAAVARESEWQRQIHRRLSGLTAYPFSRSRRVELSAGLRQIEFDRELHTRLFTTGGRLVSQEREDVPGPGAVNFLEASAALVHDSTIFGATSPILGTRYRVEVAPNLGGLSLANVLVDYRRYAMPVRPVTVGLRVLHAGRYGRDAGDDRLLPLFLGYRSLVRGYEDASFGRTDCGIAPEGGCAALEDLFGTRLLVGKLELRVPLPYAFSRRIRYGPVPIEGVVFADAGVAWTAAEPPAFLGGTRGLRRAVGVGVRANVFGMILGLDAARPLDRVQPGWRVSVDFRPGF